MLQRSIYLISLGLLAACQDALGPNRGDPAQYALTGFEFVCSQWKPSRPPFDLGLFDISFPPTLIDESLNSTKGGAPPSAEQHHAILALGGTIIHEFQVPMIRAILPISNVPRLFRSPFFQGGAANGISDPTNLKLSGSIGYTRPPTADDMTLLHALGVQITLASVGAQNSLLAVFPDSAVPVLRARPEIQWVQADAAGCNHVGGSI